ncbi:MAG TPA: hypothetical protein VMF12_19160 [Xanthobacteraceae bacterium]|nr:hypothetical protein [Xanthobacteraceae bacterium]
MATRVADRDKNAPVTLHRVMQRMIGEGLKARYEPPKKLSHELFVLLMQLKENESGGKGRRVRTKTPAEREAATVAAP